MLQRSGKKGSRKEMEQQDEDVIPPHREKLYQLFQAIEKEFDSMYLENMHLHEKVDLLTDRIDTLENVINQTGKSNEENNVSSSIDLQPYLRGKEKNSTPIAKKFTKVGATMRSKFGGSNITSSGLNVKHGAEISKISEKSNFANCSFTKPIRSFRDGVWEVTSCNVKPGIIGTACADGSSWIIDSSSGHVIQEYLGHTGSVNSIRFCEHNGEILVVTASGDHSAHLWKINSLHSVMGSEEDLNAVAPIVSDHSYGAEYDDLPVPSKNTVRSPMARFSAHSGVVSCADFLDSDGEYIISASWDRSAVIYNSQTGEVLNTLLGHDDELTHLNVHPTSKLFVTSSRDATFRLWDFRVPIHSVSVFQGHTDAVTSTAFSPSSDREHLVVSGSDDRTIKIWDLRHMRAPEAVIRQKSGVNRLSVNNKGFVAIPLDNRQIIIFDANTNKLLRLPRKKNLSHSKIVTCASWLCASACKTPHWNSRDTASFEKHDGAQCNLFTSSFDNCVMGWKVDSS